MTHSTAFKTPEGEAAYLAAYDAAMTLWPVPYEEIQIPSRFGLTHVVASGPEDAPPLVLLHGFFGTLAMWSPNIADFSQDHRVYAIDIMGHPSKSIPDEPIRDAADLTAWLSATLDELNLDRFALVGLSYGGWLALYFTLAKPERVQKLVLLSPAASFQMPVRQFVLRGLLMGIFPSRLALNSFFGWMGYNDHPDEPVAQHVLDLVYLGLKHFRFPSKTRPIEANVFSDDELRTLDVPALLLIGENEVMYDAAEVLDRARCLIPNFEGELVPQCSHEMSFSQYPIVNARALDFLHAN
jgi:pimeloyl-ACP methyl ester carboxylesterase